MYVEFAHFTERTVHVHVYQKVSLYVVALIVDWGKSWPSPNMLYTCYYL